MAGELQIRARMSGSDTADVKVLIAHPMETGARKDAKTKNLVPAHFIKDFVATLNGKPVLEGMWGSGVAKNPFVGFKVQGAKAGDFIAVKAVDNLGEKFEHNAIII
jgi:sulfur-oxidizing protein SoxZ